MSDTPVIPDHSTLYIVGGIPVIYPTFIIPDSSILYLVGGTPTVVPSLIHVIPISYPTLTILPGTPLIDALQPVIPTSAELELTTGTPLIDIPNILEPETLQLTITGGEPDIVISLILVITGGTPEILAGISVTPDSARMYLVPRRSLVFTTDKNSIVPQGGRLSLRFPAPIVTITENNVTITPDKLWLNIIPGRPELFIISPTGDFAPYIPPLMAQTGWIVGPIAIPLGAYYGPNMILNPIFTTTDDWSLVANGQPDPVLDEEVGHSTLGSLRFDNGAGGGWAAGQTDYALPVVFGQQIIFGCWVKTSNFTGYYGIVPQARDWQGNFIRNEEVGTNTFIVNSNTADWHYITGVYTVAVDADLLYFILFSNNQTSGSIWFDEVSVESIGAIAHSAAKAIAPSVLAECVVNVNPGVYEPFTFLDEDFWYVPGSEETVSNGELSIVPRADWESYIQIKSNQDMIDSAVIIKPTQMPTNASVQAGILIQWSHGASFDRFEIDYGDGWLGFGEIISATWDETWIEYDPDVHVYWCIRVSGPTVYWETSVDGETWTIRRQKSWAVDHLTGGSIMLYAGGYDDPTPFKVSEFKYYTSSRTTTLTPTVDGLQIRWGSTVLPAQSDSTGIEPIPAVAVGGMPELATASSDAVNPVVSIFNPITYENQNKSSQSIPAGASGCWVTLIGAGGGGGYGYMGEINHGWTNGGGGGGGGGRCDRFFIPVASLGATYSITRGLGSAHANGGASTFTSGSITMTANGGNKGGDATSGSYGTHGIGGTASVSGIGGAETHSGASGGQNGSNGDNETTNGAGAGGGAGGANNDWNNACNLYNGGHGGNSVTKTGGTDGSPGNAPSDATAGNGGAGGGGGNGIDGGIGYCAPYAGGNGGKYGGGGGGTSPGNGNYTQPTASKGGDGYTKIEWV